MSAEALLVTLLSSSLPQDVSVCADVPARRPARMVTVERVGGTVDRFLDRGVYALQAWAPSRAEAAALAVVLASTVLVLPAASGRVAAASVVSVVNLPDPDSRTPRYQVTANVTTTTTT